MFCAIAIFVAAPAMTTSTLASGSSSRSGSGSSVVFVMLAMSQQSFARFFWITGSILGFAFTPNVLVFVLADWPCEIRPILMALSKGIGVRNSLLAIFFASHKVFARFVFITSFINGFACTLHVLVFVLADWPCEIRPILKALSLRGRSLDSRGRGGCCGIRIRNSILAIVVVVPARLVFITRFISIGALTVEVLEFVLADWPREICPTLTALSGRGVVSGRDG
jgi:hypothetical protein